MSQEGTPSTVGGGSALGLSVLVVWLAGRFGLSLSAEIGTVIGGLTLVIFAAFWAEGITGVVSHLWRGNSHHDDPGT